jgi:Domain of unknown function (DUF4401)
MSEYQIQLNARQVIDIWVAEGLVKQDASSDIKHFIEEQNREKQLPLYLRTLMGGGAFFSSLFFISFLIRSEIIPYNSEIAHIIWGIFFIMLALFLGIKSNCNNTIVKHTFFLQTSFCLIGVGKALFVIGFATIFGGQDSNWGVTLAALIVTLATYNIYQLSIDRYLSSIAILTSVVVNIISINSDDKDYCLLAFNLFLANQLLIAALLFTYPKIKRQYTPIAYALASSIVLSVLCIELIPMLSTEAISFSPYLNTYLFSKTLFTIALIGLIIWAAGGVGKLKTEPVLIAVIGAILLGIFSTSGVILSICFMILGYGKHDKLLLLLGILLNPIFICLYYYNLKLTLMAKSWVLIASGFILLAGKSYLKLKGMDKERA